MTGIICLGMTERGSFKIYSEEVRNIKLPLKYSEFTVHMQNQCKAGSFVGTNAGLSHDMQFFSFARAME